MESLMGRQTPVATKTGKIYKTKNFIFSSCQALVLKMTKSVTFHYKFSEISKLICTSQFAQKDIFLEILWFWHCIFRGLMPNIFVSRLFRDYDRDTDDVDDCIVDCMVMID